jgi:hypothetical protein
MTGYKVFRDRGTTKVTNRPHHSQTRAWRLPRRSYPSKQSNSVTASLTVTTDRASGGGQNPVTITATLNSARRERWIMELKSFFCALASLGQTFFACLCRVSCLCVTSLCHSERGCSCPSHPSRESLLRSTVDSLAPGTWPTIVSLHFRSESYRCGW